MLQILIQPPNGTPRPLMCKKGVLTVGSGSFNDLVLNDVQVKPEHLRLEFIGNSIQVTYLDRVEEGEESGEFSHTPPKQEIWRPNTSIAVGQHMLTLQEVPVSSRSGDVAEVRVARALLGPGIELSRLGCAGAPFMQLVRLRGPLSIIFAVGLLIGTLARWIDRVPTLWGRAAPTPTVQMVTATPTLISSQAAVIAPVTVLGPAPTVVVIETVDVTSAQPTATPTRMLIQPSPVAIGVASTSLFPARPGGLVDGPVPPTPVPPPTATPLPAAGGASGGGVPGAPQPTEAITLDSTLQQLGVWVEPAVVPSGTDYWRVASVRWLNPDEAQGRNTIMLEVVNKSGQRVVGQPLLVAWKDGNAYGETNKPNPEIYAFDFPMNASGNAYSVRIDGQPSETLHGLGMGTLEDPLAATKTSFYVTFQLVTKQ